MAATWVLDRPVGRRGVPAPYCVRLFGWWPDPGLEDDEPDFEIAPRPPIPWWAWTLAAIVWGSAWALTLVFWSVVSVGRPLARSSASVGVRSGCAVEPIG